MWQTSFGANDVAERGGGYPIFCKLCKYHAAYTSGSVPNIDNGVRDGEGYYSSCENVVCQGGDVNGPRMCDGAWSVVRGIGEGGILELCGGLNWLIVVCEVFCRVKDEAILN